MIRSGGRNMMNRRMRSPGGSMVCWWHVQRDIRLYVSLCVVDWVIGSSSLEFGKEKRRHCLWRLNLEALKADKSTTKPSTRL
jgi:hypothetical protein